MLFSVVGRLLRPHLFPQIHRLSPFLYRTSPRISLAGHHRIPSTLSSISARYFLLRT